MRNIAKNEERRREAGLLSELYAVYRAAGEAFAGWSCPTSTECCRFGITGREPYVTSIELTAILRAIAARGGRRALRAAPQDEGRARAGALAPKRRLPTAPPAERACPMLTEAGLCAIYDARPLGCRTFYCERAAPGAPVRHRDVGVLVRRVQEIAARHMPGGDLGRPLTRALAEKGERPR